ncbi:MAG: NADH-quinone oxidoreductase subunit A [Acidobacteria bacterium]|nr:NADH-quinone oxidoreductase subunit A [Acidobacteriota bacterium]
MILSAFAVVGLVGILGLALSLFAAGIWRRPPEHLHAPPAWKQYRFGFATYALIFLAFDMEMIFMYPWGVVFAGIGIKAFADMLVFICLLAAGISYAWAMGGLKWE